MLNNSLLMPFLRLKTKFKNRLSFLRKPIFTKKIILFSTILLWFLFIALNLFLGESQNKNQTSISLLKKVEISNLPLQKTAKKIDENFFLSIFSRTFQPFGSENVMAKDNSSLFDDNFLISIQNPAGTISSSPKTGILTYKVKRGDSLIKIAKIFNISLSTILSANHLKINSIIRPGMNLSILPVTGILYTAQEGDTLVSVAEKFNISTKDLIRFNNLKDKTIKVGDVLTIPGIVQRISSIKKNKNEYSKLPKLRGYFSPPCEGLNYGILHPKNAVDISNICGTKIYSAQEGLIIEAKKGFNKGYGNYILIQHPNGTQTLYAYLEEIEVKEGTYVKKGQEIGKMGNSGEPESVKGCHLHFEVYGAKNFLAK